MARTHAERRQGLRPRPRGRGLALATCSVHSFGMAEPLGVVTLDGAGRVRRAAVLPPGRLLLDPGARWVLEVPRSRGLPPVGAVLAAAPILGACPGR